MTLNVRVGHGYDVHQFCEGRKVILGGIEVPYPLGLKGHSDADVLSHAICDALLGAAGLRDIGSHFPDTDPQYKGADSAIFLKHAVKALAELGWQPGNIDATIICQEPRISPHVEAIRNRLAKTLAMTPDAVNIKATTTEGLGYLGRKEGIAAHAVALIGRSSAA